MQGFNRYIPPDFDPKKNATLNSYQGKKHALGKRAKDIDKGVLVVRFELPFNIWCGTCENHIGAGVRYNAQKRKVGNYYSTPIFAFRCKCHLCSGWFEIQTDPQNAQYLVTEGARRKDEDWNPEENGGYATYDTEQPSGQDAPADPFAHLEKTVDQQTWAETKTSRLTQLTEQSARLSSDPYAVSLALRRRFREEKKVALAQQARDDNLKSRYGMDDSIELGDEDVEGGRDMWEAGREHRGLPVDAAPPPGPGPSASVALASLIKRNTKRRYDPFADVDDELFSTPKARGRVKTVSSVQPAKAAAPKLPISPALSLASGLLSGYGSD